MWRHLSDNKKCFNEWAEDLLNSSVGRFPGHMRKLRDELRAALCAKRDWTRTLTTESLEDPTPETCETLRNVCPPITQRIECAFKTYCQTEQLPMMFIGTRTHVWARPDVNLDQEKVLFANRYLVEIAREILNAPQRPTKTVCVPPQLAGKGCRAA